jgi:hypothetical protein
MEFAIDGENQLVIGFDDGTVQVRKHRKGIVVETIKLASPIAMLTYFDYRNNGSKQLIAVTAKGSIHAYTPSVEAVRETKEAVTNREQSEGQELIELNKQKISLTRKIESIQE